MKKVSKRVSAFRKVIAVSVNNLSTASFSFDEVFKFVEEYKKHAAKFNESLTLSVELGVDPKKSDQVVKSSCVLPHGSGKMVNLLAFAEGADVAELKKMGVKYVGSEDLINDIISGSIVPGKDFNACISTQDYMPKVAKSKAVQILGRAGLMPNLKIMGA